MGYSNGDILRYEFKIEQVLTSGGMGEVFIVQHQKSRIRYAAKTFKARFFEGQPDRIDLFERECRIWVGLRQHPNVVKAVNVFRIDDRPFVLLEHVPGGNLAELLARRRIGESEAIDLTCQICEGMAYVHETAGLIHCDLKPPNVLMADGGRVKVTDFGLAARLREKDTGQTDLGGGGGTLPFMAPEQFVRNGPLWFSTDIYGMGVMLFYLLSGRLPFVAPTWEEYQRLHCSVAAPDVRCYTPGVSAGLAEVVAHCLAKNHTDRYQDFHELQVTLLSLRSANGWPAPTRPRGTGDGQVVVQRGRLILATVEMVRLADVYNAAVTEFELGAFGEALPLFDKALEMSPDFADAWNGKGNALCQLGRTGEAEPCYRKAVELDPHMAEAWVNLARLCQNFERLQEALVCIDRALECEPAPPFWIVKGGILEGLGREQKEVEAAINNALDLNPRSFEALLKKALLLLRKGRRPSAIVFLNRALETNPRADHVRHILCEALAAEGRHYAAVKSLEDRPKLGQLPDGLEECRLRCLIELGDFDEALQGWSERASSESATAEDCHNCGLCLQMLGRLDESAYWYRRALELNPEHFGAVNNLGACCFERGQLAESLEWYERAGRLQPGNPVIAGRIAFVKEKITR